MILRLSIDPHATSDLPSVRQVVIPPVENLSLRSAACCGYCGCSCTGEDRPIGCTFERTCCCFQQQAGCQALTTEVLKRAFLAFTCLINCLNCEQEQGSEFVVYEISSKGLACCCFECGNAAKVSCCPQPITCIGAQGQNCCCYYRFSLPCDATAPCEIGLCGIFCVEKTEEIKEAEEKLRSKSSKGAIEAVIVEKGGAPAEEITDADVVIAKEAMER